MDRMSIYRQSYTNSMDNEIKWLLQEKYHGEKSRAFFADCQRLKDGAPLAYVIGQIPFLDCVIHLDSKPLIPRPETEFWTEKAIQNIRAYSLTLPRILDLCAGSGAIGVAVAKSCPTAVVHFSEIDSSHFPTITKNLECNLPLGWKIDPYEIFNSDLFMDIPDGYKYDFILSNPPYIDKEAGTVDTSVADHEPHLALFGGDSGLELIRKIISQASNHLNPGGQLWIEHEPTQSDDILQLGQQNGYSVVTHRDQYNVYRYSVLTMAQ